MNGKQIDLIMNIVREKLEYYLAPPQVENIAIGILNEIGNKINVLQELEENDAQDKKEGELAEIARTSWMNRRQAINNLRRIVRDIEKTGEIMSEKEVFVLSINLGDLRAMKRAIIDMMNIEEVSRIINKKEEYDDETAVF